MAKLLQIDFRSEDRLAKRREAIQRACKASGKAA